MADPLSFADRDTAIRTMVGEASNQGEAGLAAVAWVIRNRAEWEPPAWWGRGISAVCLHPHQFDCWDPGPDLDRIKALATTDPEYREAADVFDRVMGGQVPDPTGGSTTYKVRGTVASWDKAVAAIAPRQIGGQDFWRLPPHGLSAVAFIDAPPPTTEAA